MSSPECFLFYFLARPTLYRSTDLGDLINLWNKMCWDPDNRKYATVSRFI